MFPKKKEFFKIIEQKEKKLNKKEKFDNYINDLANLLSDYEKWFESKKGRKRQKKEKFIISVAQNN